MPMIVYDLQAFQHSALSPVEDDGEQSTAACRALRSWGRAWAPKANRASERKVVDFAMIDARSGIDQN